MDRSIFTKKVETAAASYVEAFYAECTALSDDDLIDALRVAHETIDNASDARNQAMRSGFLSDYDPVLALAHLWAAECCARNRSIPIIHHFRTSRDAYDACQCSDQIKDGDFLLIRSEGVLGVADTWPWAISAQAGLLHINTDQGAVSRARATAAKMKLFDFLDVDAEGVSKSESGPSPEQLQALIAYAAANGRGWKTKLQADWAKCRGSAALIQLRNQCGPKWLTSFRLPKA